MSPTADPRDARIAELERRLVLLERIVDEQARRLGLLVGVEEENARLRAENAELKAKLGQNSTNSHQPPSSDKPGIKREKGKSKGGKRGGQRGHEGAERKRLPATDVKHYWPDECRRCGATTPHIDAAEPRWWQVVELPEIKPEVIEHQAHACACACGAITQARLPGDVLQHGFGPNLSAFVAYLTGRCRLSKRQVMELLEDALGTPMGLGSVSGVEKDVSEALAAPVAEALAAVREQPVVHADETGWREDKKRAWLWVAVTSVVIAFRVARSRSKTVAQELLGESFAGRLVTDRWSAYNWVDVSRRQLCWAHLLRDMQGMSERGGIGGVLGDEMLQLARKMMRWWSEVRDGSLPRTKFKSRMGRVRARVGRLLRDAAARAEKKTAGMCGEILSLESALWTFVDVEGIEPKNNVAERAIRPAVLWRKGSFGNDSETGSRFTERILTAVATARLKGANVLRYLRDACASYRSTRTTPSLLTLQGCG